MKISKLPASPIDRQKNPIALIDTRSEIEGKIIGTLIGLYDNMENAFTGNRIFQARMRAGGEGHIRTKIVTLKERKEPLRPEELVHTAHVAGEPKPKP